MHALVERLGVHHVPEQRDGLLGPAQQQCRVGVQQDRLDAAFVGHHRGRVLAQDGVRVGEHRPPPPCEGLGQCLVRGLRFPGAVQAFRLGEQFVEVAEVDLVPGRLEEVAGGRPGDGERRNGPRFVGFEKPADLADVGVDQALVGARRSGGPEGVGDLLLGGGLGVLECQQPEQAAQHRAGDGDWALAAPEERGPRISRRGRAAARGGPVRVAASRSTSSAPVSPRVSARRWRVRDWGRLTRPRSMSRSARVLIPARAAAASWLRPARLRNAWSCAPNEPCSPGPPRGSPAADVLSDMASPSSDDRDPSIVTGCGIAGRARPTLQRLRQ